MFAAKTLAVVYLLAIAAASLTSDSHCAFNISTAAQRIKACLKVPIHLVNPGLKVFVDIRCFTQERVDALQLPGGKAIAYFVPAVYGAFTDEHHIEIRMQGFSHSFVVDNVFVNIFGNLRDFVADDHNVLLSPHLSKKHRVGVELHF